MTASTLALTLIVDSCGSLDATISAIQRRRSAADLYSGSFARAYAHTYKHITAPPLNPSGFVRPLPFQKPPVRSSLPADSKSCTDTPRRRSARTRQVLPSYQSLVSIYFQSSRMTGL